MADPEGVPLVPWNPSFEGLLSKILCANVLRKLRSHWSYFSFNSSNTARVSTPVSTIRRMHGLRACIYYQKHVATWQQQRVNELKLIHALLPLQLRMAICYQYDYESTYFPAPYMDNQLLCSLCDLTESHL